ncbi:MAG: hypothetical protein ABL952_12480, partial [Pyrinomonadaceae bacterium]
MASKVTKSGTLVSKSRSFKPIDPPESPQQLICFVEFGLKMTLLAYKLKPLFGRILITTNFLRRKYLKDEKSKRLFANRIID